MLCRRELSTFIIHNAQLIVWPLFSAATEHSKCHSYSLVNLCYIPGPPNLLDCYAIKQAVDFSMLHCIHMPTVMFRARGGKLGGLTGLYHVPWAYAEIHEAVTITCERCVCS